MKYKVITIVLAVVLEASVESLSASTSIHAEPSFQNVIPGNSISMLFLIESSEPTPIFGYSVDIDIVQDLDTEGLLSANAELTNFFDERNLITAGGATRDPEFSQILSTSDGGVFITTNTADDSTVMAVPGVNDVLAEVFVDVPLDAKGEFRIELGPASTIGEAGFSYESATIIVVPEPTALTLLLIGMGVLGTRPCGR